VVFEPPAQGSLLQSPRETLEAVISRGSRTERYGREWIVGPTETRRHTLSGRIGFRGEGGFAELWDEATSDFVEYAIPNGLTAPFAIDLEMLTGLMQVRPPLIRVNSLIGAFEKLLADSDGRWLIRGAARETSLDEWKSSVAKVTSVRMTVRIPNPEWQGAPDLKDILENAEADVVNMEMQSEAGLNLDSPFVAQTQHHIDRGYGEARYVGVTHDVSGAHETVYSTRFGSEEVSDEVAADQQTGEVPPEALRERLVGSPEPEETGRHDAPGEGAVER